MPPTHTHARTHTHTRARANIHIACWKTNINQEFLASLECLTSRLFPLEIKQKHQKKKKKTNKEFASCVLCYPCVYVCVRACVRALVCVCVCVLLFIMCTCSFQHIPAVHSLLGGGVSCFPLPQHQHIFFFFKKLSKKDCAGTEGEVREVKNWCAYMCFCFSLICYFWCWRIKLISQ